VRLAQLSTVLAAIAIGAAAILYFRLERLEARLSERAEARQGGRSAEPEGVAGAPERDIRLRDDVAATPAGVGARHASAGSSGDAPAAASLEERIARLEQRSQAGHGMPLRLADRYAHTVDDLSKQLSLTPTQRTRIEDAVARGKQRIEDLLKIPDETGKSPYERRAETRKKIEEAMKKPQEGAGLLAFATDLVSYKKRKIPGRNETYGDEINRVRKETREEIGSALDSKQRETFDQTNVDGLLGESAQVSFAYAMGEGPAGETGGIMVEMDATEVMEAPEDGAPPPSDGDR
jgi:hypothetical protein